MFGTLVLDNEPWLGTIARSEVITVDMKLQRSSEFLCFFSKSLPPQKTTALSKEKPYALESWMNYKLLPSCHLVCFVPVCCNLRVPLASELCQRKSCRLPDLFSPTFPWLPWLQETWFLVADVSDWVEQWEQWEFAKVHFSQPEHALQAAKSRKNTSGLHEI